MTRVNTDPHEPTTAQSSGLLPLTDCRVDLNSGRVSTSGGEQRLLRELEREVLAYLVRHAGQTVTQEQLLRDVWGYDSHVVTRTVYTTIRRLRHQIESDPARPRHILTVRGEGYQFAPLRGPEPGAAPAIIGREREIREVRGRLADGHRLVTLLGPAGIGKTCLATYLAATSEGAATLVDLSSATTVPAVVSTILQALDLHESGAGTSSDRLGERLAARGRRLLVLDNFEHLVSVAATALGQWHRAAPAVQFLVTSQVALRLMHESVLEVGPLPMEEARALLVQRATRAGHVPPVEEATAVDDIVKHLEGVPLALELAASRLRILSAPGLLGRLQDGQEVLRASWRDGPERHNSMAAALASSWQLLQAPARQAAAQCTVFAGPFVPVAFEAVVSVSGADPLDVLADLKDHSWIRLRDGQLGMFDSLRRYARSNLRSPREVFERHADWAMEQPGSLATVAELSAVVDRFVQEDPERAARAALRASDILISLGHTELECELLERAAVAHPHLEGAMVFALARRRVGALRKQLRFEACHQELEVLRPLAQSLGAEEIATWWYLLGAVQLYSGHPEEADAALDEARTQLEQAGPGHTLGLVLSAQGVLRKFQGRTDDAVASLRAAVTMLERFGTPHDQVVAVGNIAAALLGRWAEMARAARRAAEVSARHGSKHTEGVSLGNLALALHESGDPVAASPIFEESLERLDAVGDTRIRARVMGNYGLALFSIGDHEGAIECLDECVVAHEAHGDALSRRVALGNRGALKGASGRVADGEVDLREALATFRAYPAPRAHQVALCAHLVVLLAGQRQVEEAEEWLAVGRAALSGDDPASVALLDVAQGGLLLARGITPEARAYVVPLLAAEPTGWDHRLLQSQLRRLLDSL